MIVSCPGCHKRYDISAQVKEQKESYKLKCMHCGKQWRISQTPKKVKQSSPSLFLEPRKIPPLPKVYSHWHDFIKRYSLDWILILGASTLAVLVMAYEGQELPKWLRLPFASQVSVNIPSELKIENVEFTILEQKNTFKFVVKGEIVNHSSEEILCPDLNVTASGEYRSLDKASAEGKEAGPQSPPEPRRLEWVHQMLEQPLRPGERRPFESISPEQMEGLDIKEVEVTWHSPHQKGVSS